MLLFFRRQYCLFNVCIDMRRFAGGLFLNEGPRAHWGSFWSEEGPRIVWEFFLAWRRASNCVGVLREVKKGLELWGSSSWRVESLEQCPACLVWGPRTVWSPSGGWRCHLRCVNPVTYSLSPEDCRESCTYSNVIISAVPNCCLI